MDVSAIESQLAERYSRMNDVSQRIDMYTMHINGLLNACHPRAFEGRFEGTVLAQDFEQWQLSVEARFTTWASWDLTTSLSNWRTMMDDIQRLWRSHPWPQCHEIANYLQPELSRVVEAASTAMSTGEAVNELFQLPYDNACEVIDLFDAILMEHAVLLNPDIRNPMFRTMRKLCAKHVVLPPASLLSPHELIVEDEHPIAQGGFGEIRRGQWQRGGSIVHAAFKSFTPAQNEDLQQVRKQIYKEAIQWRHLHHPNVVPFLGVCDMPPPLRLCIVSHWMENGNIMDFLRQNLSADRHRLLVEIATGLQYLHSKDIVHGDLKGANILINNGVPRLADFGLATVVYRMQTVNTASGSHGGGTYRWMAPELFDPEEFGLPHAQPSKETDVYGLAMVMWEVYTCLVPFYECRNEWQVVKKILSGKRPTRSEDTMLPVIQDRIWILMEECWDARPGNRPDIREVLGRLGAEDDMHSITATEQNRVFPHMRLTSEHSSIDMQTLNIPEDSGGGINVHVEFHLRITKRALFFLTSAALE